MLIIARHLRELNFHKLMKVYEQSNLEAASNYKTHPSQFALQMAEQNFWQYLQEVFFSTPGAVYYVWEENDLYISALRLEPYRDGLLLEALETAPLFRNQGYAVVLMRAVQQYLKQYGNVKIYSHVNKKNRASLRTHEKCGFRQISDCAAYINGSVDYRCFTLVYECQEPCIM